jgi:hypothetical protein
MIVGPGALVLEGVFDRGVPFMERVLLAATTPLNLSFYVIMHSTAVLSEGQTVPQVASGPHPAFWFPTLQLAAGERVLLYTGPSKVHPQGSPQGRAFYWGLEKTIFNTPADCIVVMQLNNWQTAGDLLVAGAGGQLGAAAHFLALGPDKKS